jgi:hypothetical protein
MLPSCSCCSVSSQTGEAFNVTLSNSGDTIVGADAFIQAAGASGLTAATVDQISDFGKVTVAATGAEVTAMNSGTIQWKVK